MTSGSPERGGKALQRGEPAAAVFAPRIGKQALASALLCALFLILYPLCNWITSRRGGVGSYHFAWERHIPFIPLSIVPYMSIDLFFIAAPFVTRTQRDLRTLVLRLVMAIMIASACFLVFPLRFAFERPHVGGWLGVMFDRFRTLDLPFNQFPSLHIAQLFILMDVYLRHARRWTRTLIIFWSTCIFLSTVLTYQHHVIDLLGGSVLAVLCFYFIGNNSLRLVVAPNVRVGVFHAIGAAAFFALSLVDRPWSLPLLWPAFTLSIASLGYFALGPSVFQKHQGELSVAAKIVLWPVLLGQRISLTYYARQCRAHNALSKNLWIGRRLTHEEATAACKQGVTAVIDLTGEMAEARPFRTLNYLNVPVLDLTAPLPEQIEEAVRFIERETAHGIVYLHCKAGYSRTAVVAGAYLLASGQASTVEDAIQSIRRVRPTVVVRPEAMQALRAYEARSVAIPHQKLRLTSRSRPRV